MTVPAQFERTEILLTTQEWDRLSKAHVMVAGLGGVGGQCADALARAGIGQLTLIDSDTIVTSNINRQLPALLSTVGQAKIDVLRQRIHDINPDCQVNCKQVFLTPDNMQEHITPQFDYIVDCIDTLPSKVSLIASAHAKGIPIAASMGAGNRIDPSRVHLADISHTHGCPLARLLRSQLRKHGIHNGVLTVFSDEPPRAPRPRSEGETRPTNGTISYMPPMFGLMLAGAVVLKLTQSKVGMTEVISAALS